MKKISASTSTLFFAGIFSVSLLLGGCQKKQEEPKPAANPAPTQVAPTVDSAAIKAQAAKESAEKAAKEIKMLGTWEGEMSGKTAVLKITEQKGNEFSGTVLLMFKEKINQKVKGTVNPEAKSVKISDQLHSIEAGDYAGKFTDEGKKFSGTFTIRSNGQKLNYFFKLK